MGQPAECIGGEFLMADNGSEILMAEYLVTDTELSGVADAIRAKGGTSESLTWPDGYKAAVEAIQTGGGAKEPYIEETYDAKGNLIDVNLVGYTTIRPYAFYKCTNLSLISLPSGLTSIGSYAFGSCTNLALTSLPSGITSIGDFAFQSCSKLALTSLPSGLTSVGNHTFYGCQKLSLTSLPSGITSIGGNAFSKCTGLTSITFQGKPNSIASNAFNGCTNLKTINVPWASGAVSGAPWGATNATINYNYTG